MTTKEQLLYFIAENYSETEMELCKNRDGYLERFCLNELKKLVKLENELYKLSKKHE